MDIKSEKLFDLFSSLKESPLVFVEPGENSEVQIIYNGAYKLARLSGLDYQKVSHKEFMCSQEKKPYVFYQQKGSLQCVN